MLIFLSPAKSLDFSPTDFAQTSQIAFPEQTQALLGRLQAFSSTEIAELMGISEALAVLNTQRFAEFDATFPTGTSKQALLAFAGDVYQGMSPLAYSSTDWDFAQKHLRILSGLYGILRPMDLIQPYRLEMGTSLSVGGSKNLYAFWRDLLAAHINKECQVLDTNCLINLASQEYFAAVDVAQLQANVTHIHFKDVRPNGELKVISFNTKRARGAMADAVICQNIVDPHLLKAQTPNGYCYDSVLSDASNWVFVK